MNRWYVTFPEGIIKYYADTAERVEQTFPDAIAVDPCDDPEYLYYVEEILNHSLRTIQPNHYIIHTRFGDFIYNQFVDDKGNKLDGAKWRRIEPLRTIIPMLWDLGNPKIFYDKYFADVYDEVASADSRWTRINCLEWAKIKKQGGFKSLKVSGYNEMKYWANPQGIVYEIDKRLSEAKKVWQEYKNDPSAFADTKPPYNPDLAKNCFRMPYIPILNQNISIHDMTLLWIRRIQEELRNNIDYRIFCRGRVCYNTDLLEKIIEQARKEYQQYAIQNS